MKVYITYEESSTGGEPLTDEQWSSRADRINDYQLQQACLIKPENSWYVEEFDINAEIVPNDIFVVVVRYGSGDTFGLSYGNGCIEGVYLDKDSAMKVAKSIEDDTYMPPKHGYCQWKGYFERLESVETYVMKLRKTPKDSKEPIRID